MFKAVQRKFNSKDRNAWPSKLSFFAYILLLGNGSNIFPRTVYSFYKRSGGLLILALMVIAFLVALPVIYVELFLGRYTRRTNVLLYKACPMFIGLFIMILALNCVLLPIETVASSQFFLKAISLSVVSDNCIVNSSECYDYTVRGPIKGKCLTIAYGADCPDIGYVRYPQQFNYWYVEVNPTGDAFEVWKIILSILCTWTLILILNFVSFRQVAQFVQVIFLIELVINAIVLVMALYQPGSTDAIKMLTKLKSFDSNNQLTDDVISMVVYSCKKYGLVIPIGYTTISAYVKFKSKFLQEVVLIIILDVTFTLFLCIVTAAAAGVIAYQMNLDYEQVLINDVALYFTVFPEFLNYVEVPQVFTVIYIAVHGLSELGRILLKSLAIYMVFLNFFDLIPSAKKFQTQTIICYCVICFILASLLTGKTFANYIIPYVEFIFYHKALLLLLALETAMLFYFYGIQRLSDDIYFMTGKKPVLFLKVMWIILPIFSLVALIIELGSTNYIFGNILEKLQGESRVSDYTTLIIEYSMWITLGFAPCISMFYMVWSKNLGKPFLSSLKPDFYWGFPTKQHRMRRKNFSSTYGDRLKITRRRKKLVKTQGEIETDELTLHVDEVNPQPLGIVQFQQYFKEMFHKQKKEKRKGRIYSDTKYFANMKNAAEIATKIRYE